MISDSWLFWTTFRYHDKVNEVLKNAGLELS